MLITVIILLLLALVYVACGFAREDYLRVFQSPSAEDFHADGHMTIEPIVIRVPSNIDDDRYYPWAGDGDSA